MTRYDVSILGHGIVGKTLALALAREGLRVAISAPPSAQPVEDVRAYALNARSVALLEGLKVWPHLPAGSTTPVYDMRVEGDAPGATLEFSAWQQGVRELAWIVDAAALEQELSRVLQCQPHVTVVDRPVQAELEAICEGRYSARRAALGVRWTRHDYGQTALAARLVADAPHRGVARQWFRSPDVLALLPFDRPQADCSYALVWSLPRAQAQAWLEAPPGALEQALNEATGGAAGRLQLHGTCVGWPLALAQADRVCGPGWVLLGDAAHVVHPLAGQGLNLGLADVQALAEVLGAREAWRSPGDERLLRRYARARSAPTWAMGQLTDGLLHLFAASSAPVKELRNRGLGLVNALPPLKRWLTARALDA
ncbi:FAD-dependent monooxygenase [Caldimonas sp.]|uniref:FAD-dependent monooxygenase n=1 Tax=Caldimonas sp. TaxID=2838790 RepID=UPI00391CD873